MSESSQYLGETSPTTNAEVSGGRIDGGAKLLRSGGEASMQKPFRRGRRGD
jgi:hypothetical protein